MLSITVIVIIVAAVSGLVNVKTEEQQLLNTMILGADQLSKGITSATWHAMLDDHREAAYQVMQTIALKQGIDRIRMFNRAGPGDVLHQRGGPRSPRDRPLPDRSPDAAGPHPSGQRRRPPPRRCSPRSTTSRSCSQAECHAHPAGVKVLGVLDLRLTWRPWTTKWPA